ncbi:MAG: type II toxin-antitoxin system HipA family toxin [Bacteroidia bacterium]
MAAKNQKKEILVFAHWKELHEPTLMGILHVIPSKGTEIFSFEYTKHWVESGYLQQIDPDLQMYSGHQYATGNKNNFGVFLDSSPDRWGRVLMKRREAALAKSEGRTANTLLESDYLLGVFDKHRMGALRFKTDLAGTFLDDNTKYPTPQWASLKELEHASLELEKEDIIGDPDYIKWLNMLVSPGASLGGARPKASVIDHDGNLWIAKFPSRNDIKDIGAWEAVTHDLAIKSGINMADIQVKRFTNKHHTFLTKRFDRTPVGERIHFASAMTLLGHTDGTDHHTGASYIELAEFIIQRGAKVNEDLLELWKRIVFSISVTNTDDHLRNHGFLLTDKGWMLSPAYDVNPVEDGTGLILNISEDDNSLDFDLALSVAPYFRIDENEANKLIKKTQTVVSTWREVAKQYNISHGEQELMSTAFRI